ncbi:glycine-rich RNA-binding protein 2 [Quercus suber]|uniref:glycine-rich RNA-binding protein 2 n=1 Tax=Quercus suber TaxID=58331 RepID=UPI0032DF2300
MWATTTTVSFPFYTKAKPPNSLSSFATNNRNSLKLKASLSDYPLASRIMVRNLPYSTNESSLQQQFSNFGQIAEGKSFIQYTCQEDAMLALENMDNKNFDGRVIYVELAKPGGDASKGYLRTLGPPKVPHLHFQEQDEVPDCWY